MQGTIPGLRKRGRPRMDGQRQDVDRTPVEESVRMTEDMDKWRKYVHGVANPSDRVRLKNGTETGVVLIGFNWLSNSLYEDGNIVVYCLTL